MAEGRAKEIADERSPFVTSRIVPEEAVAPSRISVRNPASGGRRPIRQSDLATAARAALILEWERGTFFVLTPVFIAAGVIAYYSLAVEPSLAALGAAGALLSLASFLSRMRPVLHHALLALLLVVLGMLFAAVETRRAGTKVLGGEISTSIKGRVIAIEHQASGRVRLTMNVLETARPKLRFAPDRVRVSARKVPDELVAGAVLSGIVRLFPPSGPLRPGSYDFSFESYFDGIGANGFFLSDPVLTSSDVAPSSSTRFAAEIENARTALAQRIRARIGGAEGEIAAALIAGTRAGIPEEVNEALRRTGLAHVLSISGLHMALVAGTIMSALRLGFALFPGFASRRPVKKYAASVALIAIAVYLFISGSAVAAERSFIMLAVMLLAVLFDRSALTMRNLAIAAIVILVVSPHEVVGPSFQMSFAATAALIGAYAWWSQRRRLDPQPARPGGAIATRLLRSGVRYTAGIAAVSLIAGLATTIYGAYHFQRVSPLSLVANLAAMPIVSVFVMPFAVLAMAFMPFGLDGLFLDVMGWGLYAMIVVAEWFSRHSPVDAVGTVPLVSVTAMTVALLIATLATTWLRVLALPLAGIALVGLIFRVTPEAFISEDGRLMAVMLTDGRLAVNRSRPNGFTVDDWARATVTDVLAKPRENKRLRKVDEAGKQLPEKPDAEDSASPPAIPIDTLAEKDGFYCDAGLCVLRHSSGKFVIHAANAALLAPLCGNMALAVIDDATARNPCSGEAGLVLTKRQLARGGAAVVTRLSGGAPPHLTFSLSARYRPWHHHRQFSREARGIAPFMPSRQKPETEK